MNLIIKLDEIKSSAMKLFDNGIAILHSPTGEISTLTELIWFIENKAQLILKTLQGLSLAEIKELNDWKKAMDKYKK